MPDTGSEGHHAGGIWEGAENSKFEIRNPHRILRQGSDIPHFFAAVATHLMDSKRHTTHRKEKPPCQFILFGPSFVSYCGTSQPRNPKEEDNLSVQSRFHRILRSTPGAPAGRCCLCFMHRYPRTRRSVDPDLCESERGDHRPVDDRAHRFEVWISHLGFSGA